MVFGSQHRAHSGALIAIAFAASVIALVAPSPVRASSRAGDVRRHSAARIELPRHPQNDALELSIVSSDDRSGKITLRFVLPRAGIVRILLTTLDGSEVGTLASGLSSAGENRLEIDVKTIPPGQYRLTLQTRDGNASTRLVIVRQSTTRG